MAISGACCMPVAARRSSAAGLLVSRVASVLADRLLPWCDDGCVSTSSASPPVLTPRKQRGLEIFARERELRTQQSAFDRERTRIFTETGHKVSGNESQVGGEEKAVRAELRALAAERARLLEEITAREAELRARQATFDRTRRAGSGLRAKARRRPRSQGPSRRYAPSSPCCKANVPTWAAPPAGTASQ
jgi:hypothetical protein